MKRKFTVKASTSAKRRNVFASSVSNDAVRVKTGDYITFTLNGKPAIGNVDTIYYSDDYIPGSAYRRAVESGWVLLDISYVVNEVTGKRPHLEYIEKVPANAIEDLKIIDSIEYRNRFAEISDDPTDFEEILKQEEDARKWLDANDLGIKFL